MYALLKKHSFLWYVNWKWILEVCIVRFMLIFLKKDADVWTCSIVANNLIFCIFDPAHRINFGTADTESENIFPRKLTPEVLQALRGVRFIAQHIKDADKDNEVLQLSHLFCPCHNARNYVFLIYFLFCVCICVVLSPRLYFQVVQEWKFVSMVLDRFLLWVFTLSCIGGTIGIIFQSPSLYDTRKSLALELSEITIHGASKRQLTIFDDAPLGSV